MLKLHPAIVHFPVALFVLSGVFGLISLFTKREVFRDITVKSLIGGVVTSPIAVLTGLLEEQSMHHEHVDHTLLVHKFNGISLMFFFQILLAWFWLRKRLTLNREYIIWVVCLLLGGGIVLVQGYLGGKMVFEKGMGVKPVEESGMGHGDEHSEKNKTEPKEHDANDRNHSFMDHDRKEKIDENNSHTTTSEDEKKENSMQNMNHSKMKDHQNATHGMTLKEMPGMEMKNPPDTFKFRDNNPSLTRKKKTN